MYTKGGRYTPARRERRRVALDARAYHAQVRRGRLGRDRLRRVRALLPGVPARPGRRHALRRQGQVLLEHCRRRPPRRPSSASRRRCTRRRTSARSRAARPASARATARRPSSRRARPGARASRTSSRPRPPRQRPRRRWPSRKEKATGRRAGGGGDAADARPGTAPAKLGAETSEPGTMQYAPTWGFADAEQGLDARAPASDGRLGTGTRPPRAAARARSSTTRSRSRARARCALRVSRCPRRSAALQLKGSAIGRRLAPARRPRARLRRAPDTSRSSAAGNCSSPALSADAVGLGRRSPFYKRKRSIVSAKSRES